MRQNYDRFDKIMFALKQVEPSVSFELKFKEAFREAVARKHEEPAMEKVYRRFAEAAANIMNILLPEPVVLIRVASSLVAVISIGLYIYLAQPCSPTVTAKEGLVMVQGAKDAVFKEIGPEYKFKVGDIVTARQGGQVDIGLSNKYAMRLKEGSRLKIAKLTSRYGNGKAYFQLIEGKTLISVEPGFKGSEFVVGTPTATATALGTKFAVYASGSGEEKERTEVSVLLGKVKVKSSYSPGKILLAKQIVTVGAGQKTDVYADRIPASPQRLIEEEWIQLEELYRIGKKPQVILMVKNTPDRVMQLLRPCPIYISDEKPREIPRLLEEAVLKTARAIKENDPLKHLESIRLLERIVKGYPNPKYVVQLILYIGAYYEYIGYHEDAIRTFKEVILAYPDSPLASMAQCAIGIIYEKKLKDKARAEEAYRMVLVKYPNSLEAIWVESKLGFKKLFKLV